MHGTISHLYNPFFCKFPSWLLPTCLEPPVQGCAYPPLGAPRYTGKDENIAGAIRAAPFAFHFFPNWSEFNRP